MKKTNNFAVIILISLFMNTLLKKIGLPLLCLAALGLSSCTQSKYSYETVPNDPLQARIYTLDNGLKVYMTVNKDAPRIQTYIAVRVGGKNDPAETTGLAHYFEHLMFKGTQQFGTSDYAAEKPMLDEIESLFEVYRKTADEAERLADEGQFGKGSMEPKVRAAIKFARSRKGRTCIIGALDKAAETMAGLSGTRIHE